MVLFSKRNNTKPFVELFTFSLYRAQVADQQVLNFYLVLDNDVPQWGTSSVDPTSVQL